jgi:hypothetical protein
MINVDKIKEELPKEAIKQHPTKSFLSSINSAYVTERFNEVFGYGKWSVKVREQNVNIESGMVIVHVTFEAKEDGVYYECFGGNDNGGAGKKGFDLGDAYKGATTDALTKIASWIGIGVSIFKGLHDKPKSSAPDNRQWLNDEKVINQLADRVSKGLKDKVDEYLKDYKVSKATKAKIYGE